MGSWELFRYGPATKTDERRSLAWDPHDYVKRLAAKQALKRPEVSFNDAQIEAIAKGFGDYVRRSGLVVWACSIMPDHVHMVIERFRFDVEKIVIQLKGKATDYLLGAGLHPFQSAWVSGEPAPKCWARGEWKVFLDDPAEIPRAIDYVVMNPEKEGRPRQQFDFVTAYPGFV